MTFQVSQYTNNNNIQSDNAYMHGYSIHMNNGRYVHILYVRNNNNKFISYVHNIYTLIACFVRSLLLY